VQHATCQLTPRKLLTTLDKTPLVWYIITTKARKIMVMLVARAYRRSNRWSIKTGSEKVAPLTIHSLQDMALFSPRNGYWIPPPLQTVNNFLKKPLDFVSFMCYIIRIKSKRNKMKKKITFEMSNGLEIHIIETNVFNAHMRVLSMINRLKWAIEVMKINVEKF